MRTLGLLLPLLSITCVNSPAQNDSTSSDSATSFSSASSSMPEDEDESGTETEDSGALGEPGEVLWIHANQEQTEDSVDFWGALTLDTIGNYYVGGVEMTVSFHPHSLMIRKYQDNGQRGWTYQAPAEKFGTMKSTLSNLFSTVDGGLLVSGLPAESIIPPLNFQPWVGKLGAQGNLEWQINPSLPKDDELEEYSWITDIVELSDGRLVMLHRSVLSGIKRIWFHTYDSNGDRLDTTRVDFSIEAHSLTKPVLLPGGGFALGGQVPRENNPSLYEAWVAILDDSFQLVSETVISPGEGLGGGIIGLTGIGNVLWASGLRKISENGTAFWVGQISSSEPKVLWETTWDPTTVDGVNLGKDVVAVHENRAIVISSLAAGESGQIKAVLSEIQAGHGTRWTTELSLPEHPTSIPETIVYDPRGAVVVTGVMGGVNPGGPPESSRGWIAKIAI